MSVERVSERGTGTRTEEVFDDLRAELLNLNGSYQPGQRLKLLDLSARFGASMSVIREAVTRLVRIVAVFVTGSLV
jgi:DNA-binding GntR family transcriptional regulator